MRDYGKIRTAFWTDERTAGLSDKAKLLACYLLTGPHSNSIGCYRLPFGYISEDLNWSLETVTETVTETVSKGFIERCEKTSLCRICNWWKHNTIENPNVGKSASVMIDALPQDSAVFVNFINSLEPFRERLPKGFLERLENGCRNRSGNRSANGIPNPKPKPEPKPIPIPTSSSLRSEGVPPPAQQKQITNTELRDIPPCLDRREPKPNEPPDAALYRRGKEVLGKSAGGQITKLRQAHGDEKALELIEQAAAKENPAEWIAGVIRNGVDDYKPLAERERDLWAPRVKGWPGTWLDQWGPPPDDPDTLVPIELRSLREASG